MATLRNIDHEERIMSTDLASLLAHTGVCHERKIVTVRTTRDELFAKRVARLCLLEAFVSHGELITSCIYNVLGRGHRDHRIYVFSW